MEDINIPKSLKTGFDEFFDTVNAKDTSKLLMMLGYDSVDPSPQKEYQDKLHSLYSQVLKTTKAQLAAGQPTGMNPDDLLVLLQTNTVGIDNLPFTKKAIGTWIAQCSPLRGFRPKRAASGVPDGVIHKEFNEQEFHFNKPYMNAECFLQCKHHGEPVHFFYNKFPFHEYHALVVPAPEEKHEQYLTEGHLRQCWSIAETLKKRHNMRLGYNSIGAYASVNQLHYQAVPGSLPVEDARWRHNGGHEQYPALCDVFTEAGETWDWVAEKNHSSVAYNLLLSGAKAYCFARRHQAAYKHSRWTSGFAWYELSGSFIVFNMEDYQMLDVGMIDQELRMVR